MSDQQPLRPLHPESSLSPAKLAVFERFSTEKLKVSLAPGQEHCLKRDQMEPFWTATTEFMF